MTKTASLKESHFKIEIDGTDYYVAIVICSDEAFDICESIESGRKLDNKLKKILRSKKREIVTVNKEKLFSEMEKYSFLYNDLCKFYNTKEAKKYAGITFSFKNLFGNITDDEFFDEE